MLSPWALEVKRSKILQELNIYKTVFVYILGFIFYDVLVQKLICTINIWFSFVSGSFFGQDHLFNWIILGVYSKKWPKSVRISRQKLMQKKNWSMIVFLTLAVGRPFRRNDFKWKKNFGLRGYFLRKWKLYMQILTKEQKQPPVVIVQRSIFHNLFIWCLWLRIIRRSD